MGNILAIVAQRSKVGPLLFYGFGHNIFLFLAYSNLMISANYNTFYAHDKNMNNFIDYLKQTFLR